MPRPQFTLRALLVAMLVVAAFFGGMAVQKRIDKPTSLRRNFTGASATHIWFDEKMVLPDGTEWQRSVVEPSDRAKLQGQVE